ncbi:DUF4062 domain-containing protein [Geobacter grbiciae]|uniref:DUF4062 domain-containing protein n=1 Tax=Geobacter grbiciae TaxID=155042 RepID=UPI001C017D33|nr:DUF4062 domain-containing protein [Geobacter grbiciae]MBT1076858.1 DUF4062 domain-containing protein [Geobacter grbiciae]
MKIIRLFISSTFRDMHAERDWLNRVVFPELRSRCRRRGAEFVGVDLRWGVTEEESRQRGALSVCLDEIGRCDLFLGLLGDRYGWVPPPEEVPAELFAAVRDGGQLSEEEITLVDTCYQWDRTTLPARFRLRRDAAISPETADTLTRLWQRAGLLGAGESVTALEMRHGALSRSLPQGKALIFLRSEGIHRHPAFPPACIPIFAEADTEAQQRLSRLREELRAAAGPNLIVRQYRAGFGGFRIDPLFLPAAEAGSALQDGVIKPEEWGIISEKARQAVADHGTIALTGMEEFGTRVLNDLWWAIEPLLKNGKRPEITGQSWHTRFARERAARCLGRDDGIALVMGYIQDQGDQSPYILTGLPGCGKSTLMAACVERLREKSPDMVVIPWFVGAAPGSTEVTAMLRSLCEQLRRACRLDLEPSPDPDKLRLQLPAFLAAAGAVRPVALFIDALNQLDPLGGSHGLDWFPRTLAPTVKVVASTLAGPCLDRLTERLPADHLVILPPLPADSRATLTEEHLARRGKRLSATQQALLLDTAARPDAALPLYLVAALEELCCHGDFETLPERIAALPPTVTELFDQILERLERDHGADLAAAALSAVAVSRDGLLEPEIIDLIRDGGEATSPLFWTRFYRALEPFLRPSGEEGGGGLIGFFHEQLRFAAFRRYLAMDPPVALPSSQFRQAHERLAGYFRAGARKNGADGEWNPEHPRPLAELPFHLAGAGKEAVLRSLIFDFVWLQTKLQALDVAALLADLNLLPPEPAIVHLAHALRLSTSVVAVDKSQFAGQLTGRLLSRQEPELRALITQAGAHRGNGWLKPATPSLYQAGGAIERILGTHTHPVRGVAITPDGSRAISAADDATLRVWDLASGAELMVLKGHESEVLAVAVFPDGRRIASGSRDATVRLWDTETGECLLILRGHTLPVSSLAAAPDGSWLASGSWDNVVRLWDPETGQERGIIWGHTYGINALAVTPDGQTLLSASFDRTIKAWNPANGELRRAFEGHSRQVLAVTVTPDGRQFVSGSEDCTLKRWDLAEGTELWTYYGHTDGVSSVTVSPDGREIVSGSWDFTLRRWDLEQPRAREVLRGHTFKVSAAAITPDGATAVSAAQDTTLKVWNLAGATASPPLTGHGATVTAAVFTPSGNRFVTASWDRKIKVWGAATGAEIFSLTGHETWVRDVAITPDGRRAVTASHDRTVRVWDLEERRELWVFRGHDAEVWSVIVTPDGRRAFSAGQDSTLREWDLETFHPLGVTGLPSPARVTDVSPDGTLLALVAHFPTFIIRDLRAGSLRPYPPQHRDQVNDCVFLPDGLRVLTASSDRTLKLWHLTTGQVMYTLRGHNREIWSVSVTPDGRRAVSASDDRSLILWDMEALKPLATFTGDGALVPAAITPDGKTVVTGDEAGAVHLLRVEGVR